MSYASLLTPRREVLNDQIDGIIDLANISRRGRLERKPKEFLDLTLPAADVRRVVAEINTRFSTARPLLAVHLGMAWLHSIPSLHTILGTSCP